MAVTVTPNASAIKIKFDCGPDLDGKNIMKTRTYNSVKHTASDEDIMEIVNILVALQQNTLESITKVANTSLAE